MNSDTADLLARFEGLAALIDEQDAKIRQQGADIQKLKTSARTTPSGIGTVKTDDGESIGSNEGTALLTRRNLLLKGTAGVAAATALTVYNTDAASAHARTTIVGAGTGNYGAAFAVADNDPDGSLPPGASNLGIAVAASTSPLGPSPVAQSAVLGVGSGARGVQGLSHGAHGVYGQSRDANGVRGEIPVTSASNTIAVYGLNNSSFAGPGPGAGGFGVYGLSAKGHGLVGATAAPGGAAVVGATNSVPGAWAGAFYGPVAISGDLIVFGAKSAAVTHPDSSYRQLYCVESPESWFEDFGTGQLVDGRAEISIEKGSARLQRWTTITCS
jgi:hypothetical protein